MKKALLVLAILAGLILIFISCEKKVYMLSLTPRQPSSPKGVYSVTGDQTVYIYWEENDERDLRSTEYIELCIEHPAFTYLATTTVPSMQTKT